MEITITLQDLFLLVIGIAAIVFLFYLIKLLKNLVETIQRTNRVLADAEVITGIASNKAQQLDGVIGDVSEAVGSITELVKGNQNVVKAVTNIVNSLAGLKCLITDKNEEK